MSNYLGKVLSFEVRKTPTLSATAAAATAAAARLFCFRFVGTGAVVELLAWNCNNTLGQSCREQVKMCSLASRGAVAQSVERPSKGPSLVQFCWRGFESRRGIKYCHLELTAPHCGKKCSLTFSSLPSHFWYSTIVEVKFKRVLRAEKIDFYNCDLALLQRFVYFEQILFQFWTFLLFQQFMSTSL